MWSSGPPIEPVNRYDEYQPHRALLIAIAYEGIEGYRLQAPKIDLDYMYLLARQFGYQPSQIRVLTDIPEVWRGVWAQPVESVWAPDHQNIVQGCRWLVGGARESSSLFFYFSGHGRQMPDLEGTEVDGQNECLVPVDVHNPVVDDELRRELVHPLNPNARCHSGNCLDLPFTVGDQPQQPPLAYAPIVNGPWADPRQQGPQPWLGCPPPPAVSPQPPAAVDFPAWRGWSGPLSPNNGINGNGINGIGLRQDSDPLYGVGTVNLLSSSEDSQRAAGNANRGSLFTTSFYAVLQRHLSGGRQPTFREFLAEIEQEIRRAWGVKQVPHFSSTQNDMLDRSFGTFGYIYARYA